jgi:hypothetical protein
VSVFRNVIRCSHRSINAMAYDNLMLFVIRPESDTQDDPGAPIIDGAA